MQRHIVVRGDCRKKTNYSSNWHKRDPSPGTQQLLGHAGQGFPRAVWGTVRTPGPCGARTYNIRTISSELRASSSSSQCWPSLLLALLVPVGCVPADLVFTLGFLSAPVQVWLGSSSLVDSHFYSLLVSSDWALSLSFLFAPHALHHLHLLIPLWPLQPAPNCYKEYSESHHD